jgi:TonB family protein
MGAHAVARDAAGGVGGVATDREGSGVMRRFVTQALVLAILLTGCATVKSPVLPESQELPGMELAPIPLDSLNFDSKYNDYFPRVRQMIKDKWRYPCVTVKYWLLGSRCDYKTTRLVIDFRILKDGSVHDVIVRESSEFAVYNESAADAIKLAAPFPPIPEPLLEGKQGLWLRVAFKYVLVQRRDRP